MVLNNLPACAGDSTVKLWGFEKQKCVATLSDHKQAVWSVKFHHAGDWLASCSLDHSVRSAHLHQHGGHMARL